MGGDKYFNPSIKYLVQEDLVSWAENLFLKVRRVDLATTSWGSIFLQAEGRGIERLHNEGFDSLLCYLKFNSNYS